MVFKTNHDARIVSVSDPSVNDSSTDGFSNLQIDTIATVIMELRREFREMVASELSGLHARLAAVEGRLAALESRSSSVEPRRLLRP